MKKAYIKSTIDEETREIPCVKVGMYIGEVLDEDSEDCLILLSKELRDNFGWEKEVSGKTKKVWWVKKFDLKFKHEKNMEIE